MLVTISLGPMVRDLGNVSLVLWFGTAAVGAIQCILLAELTSRFSYRAGTAQYAYRALERGSPTLSALSGWCYWIGWTPGIAVNLILAAHYLTAALPINANPFVLALCIGVGLYGLNLLGLRLSLRISAVVGVACLAPLLLILIGPAIHPATFHLSRVVPLALPAVSHHHHSGTGDIALLVMKWTFVATWAAYGGEMASTLCSEVRNCSCDMPRAMSWSASICLASFAIVPVVLIAVVGKTALQRDPLVAWLPAAQALFGPGGRVAVALMLALALIFAAEAFIISSSRTVYQLACDGHLPTIFARINRQGVPIGSLFWDATVIGLMLLVFGTHVVDVVAAANVGYLIVFVLMPMAYLVLRRRSDGDPDGLRLPKIFSFFAVALVATNLLILVAGVSQWGPGVLLIGVGLSAGIIPLSLWTRRQSQSLAR